METISYAATDVGKVRDNNEDRFYRDDTHGVYAVADGVGGKPGGEKASQAIVDGIDGHAPAFARLLQRTQEKSCGEEGILGDEERDSIFSHLSRALQGINEEVYRSASVGKFRQGIASTVDLVVVGRRSAFILHVGDSRVYLIRGDEIFRVTRDHTYSEYLRQHPELLGEDQSLDHFSHVLTRSMGGKPRVEVDRLFVDVMPGDRLVLCTDGVTDYFTGADILEFSQSCDDGELAKILVDGANARGGKDNATALVVDVRDDEDRPFSRAATRPDTFRSVRFLESVDLFSELELPEMIKVLRFLRSQRTGADELVISRHDRVDGLYLLMSGRLAVEIDGEKVDEIDAGGHFGEFGLFGHPRRVADVRCLEECEILFLSEENLRRLMQTEPVLGNKLLWKLLSRTTELIQQMMTES